MARNDLYRGLIENGDYEHAALLAQGTRSPSPSKAGGQHVLQRQPQMQVAALSPTYSTPVTPVMPVRSLSASTLNVVPTSQPVVTLVTPQGAARVEHLSGAAAGFSTHPLATYQVQSMNTMPTSPTVHLPLSVLSQLDQKVGEMSSELAELQEAGKQRQEMVELDLMDNHLMAIRRVLHDDLMRDREKKTLDGGLTAKVRRADVMISDLEALQKLKEAENDRLELKIELQEVVNTVHQLREKVHDLEVEKHQLQELLVKSEEDHNQHSSTQQQLIQDLQDRRSTDIANLEQGLDLTSRDRDTKVREVISLKEQVSLYESQLQALQTTKQEQVKHTTRLEELGKLLDETQTSEANHMFQASALRLKTQDLVQELATLKITSDGQARQLKEAQDADNDKAVQLRALASKEKELQAEVDMLRRAEYTASGQVRTLNVKVASLEPRLEKAEAEYQTQLTQTVFYQERVSKMEDELKRYKDIDASHSRNHEELKNKNYDLDKQAQEYSVLLDNLRTRLRESEDRYEEVEKHRKLLERQNEDLQRRLKASEEFAVRLTEKSKSPVRPERKSLYGDVVSSKSHLIGSLLPDEKDPFVKKVREAVSEADRVLRTAMDVHKKCLDDEIQRLSKAAAISAGTDLRTIANRSRVQATDMERRVQADKVQAMLHDLNAIYDDLRTQHQLPKEVAERLEFEITRCQDDLAQLHADTPLEDIPMDVLQMLLNVHEGKFTEFPDGRSPMHWAAGQGRRDMIEYLVDKGGRWMLQKHDHAGQTPLYHAQLGRHNALIEWMKLELKVDAPVHNRTVPEFSDIPDSYIKMLDKIIQSGWRSFQWTENYTMLHWAASKGRTDICQYLVTLDADPGAKDAKGKSAIDIAADAENIELVSILKDLRHKRRASRKPTFK